MSRKHAHAHESPKAPETLPTHSALSVAPARALCGGELRRFFFAFVVANVPGAAAARACMRVRVFGEGVVAVHCSAGCANSYGHV
eukprot:9531984-Alexandrium_andersonii.AAC.1